MFCDKLASYHFFGTFQMIRRFGLRDPQLAWTSSGSLSIELKQEIRDLKRDKRKHAVIFVRFRVVWAIGNQNRSWANSFVNYVHLEPQLHTKLILT